MSRVLVAMSGGVDSSVAAALLQRQGFEVCGVTMKLLDKSAPEAASGRSCCGFDASRDARLVAESIGVPHYVLDAAAAFKESVIDDFGREYLRGRTPNPCVRCNLFMKFGYLMKKADELGCEFLATGHYAVREGNRLYKGADPKKDQAYFLYVAYEADIERILFPLGKITKDEVRRIAAENGLVTAAKPESQDICFVQDGDYAALLESGLPVAPGDIVDLSGTVLGRHNGIHKFTVGQHRGLGSLGRKMFVKELRAADNAVVVCDESGLIAHEITVSGAVVAPGHVFETSHEYDVQIRYRSRPVKVTVAQSGAGALTVMLREPVAAVAPGQSAVIYDGDMVVGGGVIDAAV
jgi:tRNA-uridine 2-sulfurtransferase